MTAATETAGRRRGPQLHADALAVRSLVTLGVFAAFAWTTPALLNPQFTILPLLRDTSALTVIGLAQLAALAIGQLNLAVGRMAAVAAMVAGFSYQVLGLGLVPGALLALAVAAAIGALTGFIIVRSHVNAFIVTLAMDFALLGLVLWFYQVTTGAINAFTVKPDGMDAVRNGTLGGLCVAGVCGPSWVPVLFVVALIIVGLVSLFYGRTTLGRELLATGASERSARLSGIPTERRVIQAHTLSGLLAGTAGLMLAITNGSFSASIGQDLLIPSFLGPVLGGTSMVGGAVSAVGTLIGTFLTLTIRQGLTLRGIGLDWLNIALGLVLLLALSVGQIRRRRGRS
ncbi:MAG: ABC transporter permease [Chloroflexota bacterium]